MRQGLAQVGDARQERFDFLRARLLGLGRFKLGDPRRDRFSFPAQLFDALSGELHYRVFGVLVLLQPQRLAVESLLDLLFFGAQVGELGVALLPGAIGCGVGELIF